MTLNQQDREFFEKIGMKVESKSGQGRYNRLIGFGLALLVSCTFWALVAWGLIEWKYR